MDRSSARRRRAFRSRMSGEGREARVRGLEGCCATRRRGDTAIRQCARAARPRREARRGRAAAFGAQAGAASIGSPMQAAGCIASARGGG
ncbi:hypothetical protein BP354E_4097 [Burkholderia pseudomallei 354e]|uniref:Uncharacterized protein n=1 Tax=Burkholderia pseudomallei (strain 1026b) TaxID=884204 RepID=A0A0H3HU72_BURP2|nr:hypothetical protein BP1026B_II1674 [Burkholderia pseudomallei 1026b]EIF58476.1 hypothetical protein BP1026A_3359 [Burkholderia pseudomallei 1026a]EIF72681.1 hypothetical protein BP354E_4097 [Burkholderia pseudomallei 354e]EIF75746.1 hypothetical protein BP354A_4885 [Burkholderia pseudomallei 354a]